MRLKIGLPVYNALRPDRLVSVLAKSMVLTKKVLTGLSPMNLDGLYATVGEFLAVLGLHDVPWQGESLVLEMGPERRLYIDFMENGALFSLGRTIPAAEVDRLLPAALRLTHYTQGLPFNLQTGCIGERELLFSLFFPPSQVTVATLSEGVDVLQTLHTNLLG